MRELNLQESGHDVHLSPLAGRGRIASAIRVRGSLREGARNRFKDARHIGQHIVAPQPQDSVIAVLQPFVANRIARAVSVLPAIHLDNETIFSAQEVDGVGPDWLLSDELVAREPARSQPIPQRRLGIGGVSSQAPCALCLDLMGRTQAEAPPHPARMARRPLPASGERQPSHKNS